MDFASINEMFRWRVERSGPNTALIKKDLNRWMEISWRRYYESVRFIAQGFRYLGVQKGDRVAIFSATRIEWSFCDLGILGCGGVVVPIYHSSPARDVEYIITHSDAKVIVVENVQLLDRVLKNRERMTQLSKIVLIEGPGPEDDEDILSLGELVDRGREQPSGLYEEMAADVGLDDMATIVYTSTSGPQLGVVHAHRQLLEQQKSIASFLPVNDREITMMFLPLSHIFGRTISYLNLSAGVKLAFAERYGQLLENMGEVNPHLLAAVPRIFQKISANTFREVELQRAVTRKAVRWCLDIGLAANERLKKRQSIPLVLSTKYKAAKKLFLDRFHQQFGKEIKYLVSSGAHLPVEIAKNFQAAGLVILEAYGLTETAGATTMNTIDSYKFGSVGRPLPGLEVQLAEDGEILIKGPTVMNEYWKDPERTANTIKDGWLHSGDIGEIDERGFLTITDRKKDLIISSGGKNIAPLNIENHFRSDPFINMLYVHGDRRNFLSALIVLEEGSLEHWAKEKEIAYSSWEELIKKPEVLRLVEERIHMKNLDLSGPEKIKKFAIIPQKFSVETGELSSTMKLQRKIIDQKYRDIFDAFYD